MEEPNSKLPLNLGLALFNPISSVKGSATVFYLQPLLTGRVLGATTILIGAQLCLLLARHFFGMEYVQIYRIDNNVRKQTVRMPIDKLQELLHEVSKGDGSMSQVNGAITSDTAGTLTTTTAEAPLVFGVSFSTDYSTAPFSPGIFFLLPVLTFPGIRGSLPLLILILLNTIFVRAVVPPETTGAKPLQ